MYFLTHSPQVVVFDDDSSSSSSSTTSSTVTSTAAAGSAMASVRVNMMSTSDASRRSYLSPVETMLEGLRRKVNKLTGATSARRAYDNVGTDYSDYQTPEEVSHPVPLFLNATSGGCMYGDCD
jgi:hypothetical protein